MGNTFLGYEKWLWYEETGSCHGNGEFLLPKLPEHSLSQGTFDSHWNVCFSKRFFNEVSFLFCSFVTR